LTGDSEKTDRPLSVYATLQKEGQIPYTIQADYLSSIKRYQIDANLAYLMIDQVNGNYKLSVVAEDPRSEESFTQVLGDLQINFNEGSSETTNTGERDDFKLYDKITNYFPPEEKSKGALIPLGFTGVIVFMFFIFVSHIYGNSANFSNLSFWGLVFAANYIGIFVIIVAFWIKINLVNTLWILLAAAPVTLFTMNKGLTPENCHISGFHRKGTKTN
jgi:hypothetical protein